MTNVNPQQPQAGWYPDSTGRQRWWDGSQWQMYAPDAPPQQQHVTGPAAATKLNVKREVVYNRQQKGLSLTRHVLLIVVVVGMVTVPYYSISPNHYWHL